jgi:hypothetical protein
VLCAPFIVWRWKALPARHFAALVAGFLLFCGYLKWQWFVARLLLPLFVLAAPAAGVVLESLAPVWLQLVVCLFLLNNSRPYLFENWVRPLKGPRSILLANRDDGYFADITTWRNKDSYLEAVRLIDESGCRSVGIDNTYLAIEYPFEILLLHRAPATRFVHTGVENVSKKFGEPFVPCAVVCLDCDDQPAHAAQYQSTGGVRVAGRFLLFLTPR